MKNYVKFAAYLRHMAGRKVARSFITEQFQLVKEYATTKRTSAAFHDDTCAWCITPELWVPTPEL